MINSMTGYGMSSAQGEYGSISVEVRTGNHRFLDLHPRLAREYAFLEPELLQIARTLMRRGRVDISVAIQVSTAAEFQVNSAAARAYAEAAVRLRDELNLSDGLDLKTILTLPGVLQNRDVGAAARSEEGAELRNLVFDLVRQGLESALKMRMREGAMLETEMRLYLEAIGRKIGEIRTRVPGTVDDYRRRLAERVAQLCSQVPVDPQRLAQEVALMAEKSDISEEMTRLESHRAQFIGLLESGREVGKKMDFLLQEMHREINTVLSKTADIEITRLGIAIKADIEKLREQAQNVE